MESFREIQFVLKVSPERTTLIHEKRKHSFVLQKGNKKVFQGYSTMTFQATPNRKYLRVFFGWKTFSVCCLSRSQLDWSSKSWFFHCLTTRRDCLFKLLNCAQLVWIRESELLECARSKIFRLASLMMRLVLISVKAAANSQIYSNDKQLGSEH